MPSSLAFIFPGQGSQSLGMLADIASRHTEVADTFDQASSVLNYDLWQLVQNGPAEALDKTMHTQPALLAASYAIWRVIQSQHAMQPAMLAGHSLGEYTALVCARALDFKDAIKLVAARGQFMQDAVAPGVGAMAAIVGLSDEAVKEVCLQAIASSNEVLTPANYNSIGQVVIAGHHTAVLRALVLAKAQGAKLAINIPVSVPSHCALMRPAAERLQQLLMNITFEQPAITVLNNTDVQPYTDATSIRDGLVKQLYMPVRWVETIQAFVKAGVTQVIECGPGKVLTGLNKRIDKNLQLQTTNDEASLSAVLQANHERSA